MQYFIFGTYLPTLPYLALPRLNSHLRCASWVWKASVMFNLSTPNSNGLETGSDGNGRVCLHASIYVCASMCVCVWWSVSDQTAVKAKKSAAGSCDKPHVPGAFAYVSRHRFAFCAKFHWKKLTISNAGNATARYQVRACRLRGVTATNLGDLGPAAATAAAIVHLRNQNPTTDNASTHESGYHKAGCWCPWTMRVDPRLHGLVGAIGNGTGVRPLGSICWEPWRFLFAFFYCCLLDPIPAPVLPQWLMHSNWLYQAPALPFYRAFLLAGASGNACCADYDYDIASGEYCTGWDSRWEVPAVR